MVKIQDDPVETRVSDLERDFQRLLHVVKNTQTEIHWLRDRLSLLLPERVHCRFCKAMISPLSEVCGACGKTLKLPADPKAGMPR